MTVPPEVPAKLPAFNATLQLSSGGMKWLGALILIACVITGVLPVDRALAALQMLHP